MSLIGQTKEPENHKMKLLTGIKTEKFSNKIFSFLFFHQRLLKFKSLASI